ncbi:MAG TPA: DoxX family protein [Acidimicrobiales bacterium]|nr:DoxX family protein [Acidimicrobiales bacterium]
MAVAACMLSMVLFLAFLTSGAQKVVFNPFMTQTAERLGFSRPLYRRVGGVEVVAAIALLAGLASQGDALARVNEAAAVVLALAATVTLVGQLRVRDSIRRYGPLLAMVALALVELGLRLSL